MTPQRGISSGDVVSGRGWVGICQGELLPILTLNALHEVDWPRPGDGFLALILRRVAEWPTLDLYYGVTPDLCCFGQHIGLKVVSLQSVLREHPFDLLDIARFRKSEHQNAPPSAG